MPSNVEKLLQVKLNRMRTNPAVRQALTNRVRKVQRQRYTEAVRRSNGQSVMTRHRDHVTSGFYTKQQCLARMYVGLCEVNSAALVP